MKNFDKSDLRLLKGSLSAIAMSIPSSRSRTGHLSWQYVYRVVNGKETRDNKTTRAIREKAGKIIKTLKS